MALAPQNEETFFREVDEELRRDRLETFFTRNGKWVAIALVLFLVALGAGLYWRQHRANAAGVHGEILTQALTDLSEGRGAGVPAKLAPLTTDSADAYRGAALMTLGSAAQVRDDRAAALAQFARIAGDTSLPQPMRDAALIRQTTLEYDRLPPAQVIARLKPLAVAGNGWFGSAGEMVAIAHLRSNQPREAGRIFAGIARDESLPETLRGRAARVAGSLGFEALPQDAQGSAAR